MTFYNLHNSTKIKPLAKDSLFIKSLYTIHFPFVCLCPYFWTLGLRFSSPFNDDKKDTTKNIWWSIRNCNLHRWPHNSDLLEFVNAYFHLFCYVILCIQAQILINPTVITWWLHLFCKYLSSCTHPFRSFCYWQCELKDILATEFST